MKNDSGTAISKPVDRVLKLIFVLVIACLSWQVQAACTFFDGFIDNKDGTVTDPRNGLIWKRCAEGFEWNGSVCKGNNKEMDWFDAMQTAKQSRFLGKADWRIPSKAEFESVLGKFEDCKNIDYKSGQYLVSRSIAHPVDADKYPGAYLTSSSESGHSTRAHYADFSNGAVGSNSRDMSLQARLVRSSQPLDGKVASEFNTEYAKVDQYKRQIAALKASYEKEDQAAAARQAKERAREDERRAKAGNARNQSSEQGVNRIKYRDGKMVSGTCASGNDFNAILDTSDGRWMTAGGRNGMQFASNLDEAVWKVCN